MLTSFTRAAGATIAAGAVLLFSGVPLDAQEQPTPEDKPPSAPVCLAFPLAAAAQSPVEFRLTGLYHAAGATVVGLRLMNYLNAGGVTLCLDESLNEKIAAGYLTAGRFNYKKNRMDLNPLLADYVLVTAFVHEPRHKMQDEYGLDPYAEGNVPEAERVALGFFAEADARLVGLLHAWEMAQQGRPEYLDFLRSKEELRPPLEAFEASLAAHPGDMPAAMRAAVLSVMNDLPDLRQEYAIPMFSEIYANLLYYDDTQPADTVLDPEALRRLGDMGPYGNYMNDELIAAIRASVTTAQFEAMVKIWLDPPPAAPAGPPTLNPPAA